MFTYNNSLNIVDSVFTILDRIERVDYVAVGDAVINFVATLAAAIVAVITYVVTALQLFWMEHGEHILTVAFRFTVWILDTIGAVYYAGVNSRPVLTLWANRVMDSAYRYAAQL